MYFFVYSALTFAKAAPYYQKTWTVQPAQYNVVKTYSPPPVPSWTWTKSFQPYPLPVATAAVAQPIAAVPAAAPISYTWTKPLWPVVYVHKTYGVPVAAATVNTASTASIASSVPAATVTATPEITGGTLTWSKTYQPVAVTKVVTTSTNTNTSPVASDESDE